MALRNIVTEEDEILRKHAKEVNEISPKIITILDDMLETMRDSNGLGIAAPQVGILKRMFIVEADDKIIELINPEIIESRGSQKGEEGCLSVPGFIGTVERPEYVKMAGLDRNGNQLIVEGTELMAVALCHEFDHLDGILYIDKATDVHKIDTEQLEEE